VRKKDFSSRFLDTKQFASLLQIPEGTLRQWRSTGVGPKWHKMQGSVRYDFAEVESYIHRSKRIPSVRAYTEEMLVSISTAG